jgi:hypothetical protein
VEDLFLREKMQILFEDRQQMLVRDNAAAGLVFGRSRGKPCRAGTSQS